MWFFSMAIYFNLVNCNKHIEINDGYCPTGAFKTKEHLLKKKGNLTIFDFALVIFTGLVGN